MAKQTSEKSSPSTASGASKSKQTSEASTPITKVITKAAEQAASTAKGAVESVQNALGNKGEGLLPTEPSMLTVKPAPTHAEIAKRAYEISQQRADGQGSDHDDWVKAEKELLS